MLALGGLVTLGCSAQDLQNVGAPGAIRQAAVTDGSLTVVTNTTQAVNRYAALIANATKGTNTVTVSTAAAAMINVKAGDLVMIIQMQGAGVMNTDDAKFGEVTALNGAGSYELLSVTAVNLATGVITLDTGCGGLRNDYTVVGKSQVVRVPQFDTVTLQPAGVGLNPARINAPAWNGSTGGVLAFRANTLVNDGIIDGSGLGFRGGVSNSGGTPPGSQIFRSTTAAVGADKGESIAGNADAYNNAAIGGRYGRGAPANGGGGGNNHNSGGGGGANGGALANWNGQGVMDASTADFKTAWGLDPFVVANGNTLTTSTGGGRGGYSYGETAQDPLVKPPGDASWIGDLHSERGGWGGRPVPNDPAQRLFVGGGGGAGHGNDGAGGNGGNGGGLVMVFAGKVSGAGKIAANGTSGGDTTLTFSDGAGGAGAGGTVVLASTNITGNTVEAKGGTGGNTPKPTASVIILGPGGGGGGGYVALPFNSALTPDVTGGVSGMSTQPNFAKFPMDGASIGGAGEVVKNLGTQAAAIPICQPADLTISVTDGVGSVAPGGTLTYEIVVTNEGPLEVVSAPVLGSLSPAQTDVSWTCTPTKLVEGVDNASCGAPSGTGDITTLVSLSPGSKATFIVTVKVPQSATGTLTYTAQVRPPLDMSDGNNANNTSRDQTTVGPTADLSLAYTTSPNPGTAGQPVTFTLSPRNAGPGVATNVKVSFDVPAGATIQSEPTGEGWTCNRNGDLYICNRTSLDANGAAPSITFTAVPGATATLLSSSGQVTADTSDPDPSNNSATSATGVGAATSSPDRSVMAGGGFGCSQSRGTAPVGLGSLALLMLAGLGLRRRRDGLRE